MPHPIRDTRKHIRKIRQSLAKQRWLITTCDAIKQTYSNEEEEGKNSFFRHLIVPQQRNITQACGRRELLPHFLCDTLKTQCPAVARSPTAQSAARCAGARHVGSILNLAGMWAVSVGLVVCFSSRIFSSRQAVLELLCGLPSSPPSVCLLFF